MLQHCHLSLLLFFRRLLSQSVKTAFRRFLIVGVLNTAFGYGVYFLALNLLGATYAALLIANVLGYAFNFLTTGRLVFQNRSWQTLPAFLLVAITVYMINLGALSSVESVSVPPWLGQLVCLPFVVVLNFWLMRQFVFGRLHL